jgi:hypothetical protein
MSESRGDRWATSSVCGAALAWALGSLLVGGPAHPARADGTVAAEKAAATGSAIAVPRPGALAPSYEARRTQRVLDRLGLVPAAAPEGRAIAFIRVVRDEVFVEDEAIPTWLNWFHVTTREQVVRRELLFEQGGAYQDARIEETMRNLRGMGIFAFVRIVAVQTRDPGAVGIVVHTRDLWSLRLETSFNATTFIDSLLVRATERNLFGYNKAVGADVTLQPKSYTLGQNYYARRVLASGIALNERAAVVVNRASQNVEGQLGQLWLGAPFYSLKQRLAYHVDGAFDRRVVRLLQGDQLLRYRPEDAAADAPYALAAYRQRFATGTAAVQVRVGTQVKHTWSVGWDVRALEAHAIAETQLPDELRADFERDVLPRQRTESGPTTSYELFTPTYATLTHLSTYGMSENVRIGPRLATTLRLPRRSFGASIASSVVSGTLGYTLAPLGGYADLSITGIGRYESERWVDQRLQAVLRLASPVFGVFRLVTRLELDLRRRDTFNTFVALGASNGLRGHVARSVAGRGMSMGLGNVELRTLPIAWQAVHVGGVLFYDVGSVFPNAQHITLHHAVGVGVRLLFPQFNRYPFSFDAGLAADRDFGFVPTISSGQVVPLTAIEETQ